jgi:REP element-mobilizing transposase RayT
MQKLDVYISDFVELYAFCLMPNHFHLLVRIKELSEIDEEACEKFKEYRLSRHSISSRYGMSKMPDSLESALYSNFVSEQFRRLFLSYSKSINKQTERSGSLFRKNFKRKEINNLQYLQNTVIYIHRNPLHHGFEEDFKDYKWSSYERIMTDKITKLKKQEVLDWFEDKENYRYTHLADIDDDIE